LLSLKREDPTATPQRSIQPLTQLQRQQPHRLCCHQDYFLP
jgi:hypothetical protein